MLKFFLSYKIYFVFRLAIGGIFLYSGIIKLFDLNGFAEVISAYGLVPQPLTWLTAVAVSVVEAAAGTGLILDIKASLSSIAVMLVMFMAVLLYGIHMGFDVDCGCFGKDDPVGDAFHNLRTALVRDVFMAAAVFYLYAWRQINTFNPDISRVDLAAGARRGMRSCSRSTASMPQHGSRGQGGSPEA